MRKRKNEPFGDGSATSWHNRQGRSLSGGPFSRPMRVVDKATTQNTTKTQDRLQSSSSSPSCSCPNSSPFIRSQKGKQTTRRREEWGPWTQVVRVKWHLPLTIFSGQSTLSMTSQRETFVVSNFPPFSTTLQGLNYKRKDDVSCVAHIQRCRLLWKQSITRRNAHPSWPPSVITVSETRPVSMIYFKNV